MLEKRKGIIISFIFIIISFSISAQNPSFTHKYRGKIDGIHRGNKSYKDIENAEFRITKENNEYMLSAAIGPIGKMPGTIIINTAISIKEDNSIVALSDKLGCLRFKLGILSLNLYIQRFYASIDKDKCLDINLSCYSIFDKGSPSTLHFRGKKY